MKNCKGCVYCEYCYDQIHDYQCKKDPHKKFDTPRLHGWFCSKRVKKNGVKK